MPNRNYRAGTRLEYLAAKELRAQGYAVVRSAGSHGPWDITAVGLGHIKLIQIKAAGAADEQARSLLSSFSAPGCVRRELWERIPGGEWVVEVVR